MMTDTPRSTPAYDHAQRPIRDNHAALVDNPPNPRCFVTHHPDGARLHLRDVPAAPPAPGLAQRLLDESVGDYPDHVCLMMRQAAGMLQRHDARVSELLEANNRYLERARAAEAKALPTDLQRISAVSIDWVNATFNGWKFTLIEWVSPRKDALRQDMMLVPTAAMRWLFGEGPDDTGAHFGDTTNVERISGNFWWRNTFRRMTGWVSGT